jgi:hypothetical protein
MSLDLACDYRKACVHRFHYTEGKPFRAACGHRRINGGIPDRRFATSRENSGGPQHRAFCKSATASKLDPSPGRIRRNLEAAVKGKQQQGLI